MAVVLGANWASKEPRTIWQPETWNYVSGCFFSDYVRRKYLYTRMSPPAWQSSIEIALTVIWKGECYSTLLMFFLQDTVVFVWRGEEEDCQALKRADPLCNKYLLCCKAADTKDTTGFPVKGVIRPSSGYDQNQQSVKSSALLSSRKNRIPQSFPWSSEVFCLAQNCSQKDGWGCSPLWPYAVPPDSSKQHKYILLVI